MFFNPTLYKDKLSSDDAIFVKGNYHGYGRLRNGHSLWIPVKKWFWCIYISKNEGFMDWTDNFYKINE
jgi:hypothetical protein